MFKLFSGDRSATTWTSDTLAQETLPGGPSPDSVLHLGNDIKPITDRHQASAEGAGAGAHGHHHQTSRTSGNADAGSMNRGGPEVGVDAHRRPTTSTGLAGAQPTIGPESSCSPLPGLFRPSQQQLTTTADTSASRSDGQSPISDAPRENLNFRTLGVSDVPVSGQLGTAEGLRGRRTDRALGIGIGIGGAFANGATTATNEPPIVAPGLHAPADDGVGRKLSKIIKSEAKAERAALHVALKELAEIQKLQKDSIKEEAVSHSWHSRALSGAHKAEMELLAARTENERRQASLRAAGEVLEASRRHARETTEMLREKMEEVERLRIYKQVDDRERTIKVKSLARGEGKRLSRIFGSR